MGRDLRHSTPLTGTVCRPRLIGTCTAGEPWPSATARNRRDRPHRRGRGTGRDGIGVRRGRIDSPNGAATAPGPRPPSPDWDDWDRPSGSVSGPHPEPRSPHHHPVRTPTVPVIHHGGSRIRSWPSPSRGLGRAISLNSTIRKPRCAVVLNVFGHHATTEMDRPGRIGRPPESGRIRSGPP